MPEETTAAPTITRTASDPKTTADTASYPKTTKTKPVYRMSSVGCLRALTAPRLGYERMARSGYSTLIMDEATRHEAIVKDRLDEASKRLTEKRLKSFNIWNEPYPCPRCLRDFGDKRYGYHAEIHTALFNAVGHLDTFFKFYDENNEFIKLGGLVPGEIKSFGKNTWTNFVNKPFENYNTYLNQIALYREGLHGPGVLFLLKNRDDGRCMVYTLGDLDPEYGIMVARSTLGFDYGGEYDMPTGKEVLAKIAEAELWAQDNELPPGEPDNFKCDWCDFRYLCEKDKTLPIFVTDVELEAAAKAWDDAGRRITLGEKQKEEAKQTLIEYGRNQCAKYVIGGISVNYKGTKTRRVIDEMAIKRLIGKDGLEAVKIDSKPWPDITIRRTKRGKPEEKPEEDDSE